MTWVARWRKGRVLYVGRGGMISRFDKTEEGNFESVGWKQGRTFSFHEKM